MCLSARDLDRRLNNVPARRCCWSLNKGSQQLGFSTARPLSLEFSQGLAERATSAPPGFTVILRAAGHNLSPQFGVWYLAGGKTLGHSRLVIQTRNFHDDHDDLRLLHNLWASELSPDHSDLDMTLLFDSDVTSVTFWILTPQICLYWVRHELFDWNRTLTWPFWFRPDLWD